MTTVYFVRHGETENPHKILRLRTPGLHLTEKGKGEAAEMAEHFKDRRVAKIFSSPIERSWETAEAISKVINVPVAVDDRLIEVGSPYQGIPIDRFRELFSGKYLYEDLRQLAEGESAEGIVARMKAFLEWVLEKYQDQTVVAVSHGDPIMILEHFLTGKDLKKIMVNGTSDYIHLAGYFEFHFEGNKFIGESSSWRD